MIQPKPGFIVDPNNPNAVIRDPASTVDINALADQTNSEVASIYDASKNKDIDIRESSKLIDELTKKVISPTLPKVPDLAEQFRSERTRLGLDTLETNLSNIDAEIARIQTQAFGEGRKASEQFASRETISSEQRVIQREAEQSVALLNVERAAVAAQVRNKLTSVEAYMNLLDKDYTNASAAYKEEYDRNVAQLNVLTKAETQQQTTAKANFLSIYTALKDSGKSFDDLPEAMRASINNIVLEAGLPSGFFESLPKIAGEDKVLSTSTLDDGTVQVVTRDKAGSLKVQTVAGGKRKPTDITKSAEEALKGEFGDIIKSASNLVGVEKGKTSKASISQAIADNDFTSAYAQVTNNVEESLTGEVKTKFANSRIDYNVMAGMKKAIQDFSDAGGNMGYLKGTADEIARKFGQLTTNPKFAALAVQLQREFQTYRLNMTGAAFSPAESKEYAAVNPRTSASLNLNLATIDGALNQLENRITSTVNSRIPNAKKLYQRISGDGMSDDDAYTEYLKLTGQSSGQK